MKVLLNQLFTHLALAFAAIVLPPSTECIAESKRGKSYLEVVASTHSIWLLTADGKIEVYDKQGHYQRLPLVESVKAQHLALDGNNVLTQIDNRLERWNMTDSTWETVGKMPVAAYGIVVNKQHHIFAITEKGVLDITTGKIYFPASSPNHQLLKLTSFGRPAAYFMDAEDKLWIGFGYGEWGGNIFAFDTQRHKFINLKFNDFNIELSPVKSFFQLKNSVGASAGLQHFTNSGIIAEFTAASVHVIYTTSADRDTARTRPKQFHPTAQPYIGPATYDTSANKLYFYSQLGVYEAPYGQDLTKLTAWHKVFEPQLHWRSGQPDAVGSPMNVLTMLALGDGKLILLTQNDGAGIWDGHSFRLLRP